MHTVYINIYRCKIQVDEYNRCVLQRFIVFIVLVIRQPFPSSFSPSARIRERYFILSRALYSRWCSIVKQAQRRWDLSEKRRWHENGFYYDPGSAGKQYDADVRKTRLGSIYRIDTYKNCFRVYDRKDAIGGNRYHISFRNSYVNKYDVYEYSVTINGPF